MVLRLFVRFLLLAAACAPGLAPAQPAAEKPEFACNSQFAHGKRLGAQEIGEVLRAHAKWLKQGDLSRDGAGNFCGANLSKLIFSEEDLSNVNFQGADLTGTVFRNTNLTGAKFTGASMVGARFISVKLAYADFSFANLSKAWIDEVELGQTTFYKAKLVGASLRDVKVIEEIDVKEADFTDATIANLVLPGTNFSGTNFTNASMERVDLTGSLFLLTTLAGTQFARSKLHRVVYEPKAGNLPSLSAIASAEGLADITYASAPHAMADLRTAFKLAGMRSKEREVTYAMKRAEYVPTLKAWEGCKKLGEGGLFGNEATALEADCSELSISRIVELAFNYVFFDLTSRYGLDYGRPLWILLALIFVFTLPYLFALNRRGESGIWMLWSKERVQRSEGQDKPVRLTPRGLRRLWYAFYFSLLSAFNIGWRDLNVGSWLVRLQRSEYTLRATGWVRSVSGLQSLLSVYLLALWVLCYFGRPFE